MYLGDVAVNNLNLNSKKSSKLKNFLIVFLVLLIIGLGGFIYSKVVEIKDENNKLKNLLQKSQSDLKNLK